MSVRGDSPARLARREYVLAFRQNIRTLLTPWCYGHRYRAGYLDELSWQALLAEVTVRVLEVGGLGLMVTQLLQTWQAARWRRPTQAEYEWVRQHLGSRTPRLFWLDEHSRTARRGRIAFVVGRVIKSDGRLSLPLLVHEAVHVSQYERWGWSYVAKNLYAQHFGGGYHYDAAQARPELRRHEVGQGVDQQLKSGRRRCNAEQEAASYEDVARQRLGLPPRWLRSVDEL